MLKKRNIAVALLQFYFTGYERIFVFGREIVNDTKYYLTLHNTKLTNSVNVSLTFYESACVYYDTNTSMWNTSGCSPNANSNLSITVCDCNHMTMFGASVQYAPVLIDFEDLTVRFLRLSCSILYLFLHRFFKNVKCYYRIYKENYF